MILLVGIFKGTDTKQPPTLSNPNQTETAPAQLYRQAAYSRDHKSSKIGDNPAKSGPGPRR